MIYTNYNCFKHFYHLDKKVCLAHRYMRDLVKYILIFPA